MSEHAHGHPHALPTRAGRRPLLVALLLLVAFLVVEVVVAVVSGSLALLSDAGHMLTDVGSLAAALWALHLASRPARGAWTFGWQRAEILSAAGNGVTLLVVAVLVAVEAIHRLIDPARVAGGPVLVVALVGIAVNLAATGVLARADRSNLNVRGAFAHVLSDLYGFAGTAVAGLVVLTTGFVRADSIASLVVVVLMLVAARSLLRDSGRVLLEGAPESIDLDEVRGHLLSTDHVLDVHDLHVWTVTSNLPALSAHVVVRDECFRSGHAPQVLDLLQGCLVGHFDVEHSTFQLEPAGHGGHEAGAHL
ncbi:cation diffusion facilitator family transporter [Jatrophihabitans endophyticus]|uniref:cation diffusion facilitator family transporter n=1 Tax=Jatrophihabitans endophyticus TaxID=1206085 RepID=UPI0019EB36D0|nr:cation diffusion facilitator family transporter [Jatrophihabitans endophyticus]MBE7188527.1 cation transporter [Jatrophihabitans endophyticus]